MALQHFLSGDIEKLPHFWPPERYSEYEEKKVAHPSPSWWFRQDAAKERQGVTTTSQSPLLVAFVVGTVYSVLLLLGPLINPPERPKLQNDPMCGIPTGEQFLFVPSTEDETASQVLQNSENPAANTKLSKRIECIGIDQAPISTVETQSSSGQRPSGHRPSPPSNVSPISGLQTLAVEGQVQQIISLLLDDSETFDRNLDGITGSGRLSCFSCNLLTSLLHGTDRTMLPP